MDMCMCMGVCMQKYVWIWRQNVMREWWNPEVKAGQKKKESGWRNVLGARKKTVKGRYKRIYKDKKGRVKKCIFFNVKKRVYQQFRIKMNQDLNGNRKLFWEEEDTAKEGKVETYCLIINRTGRFQERGLCVGNTYFKNRSTQV